MNDPEVFLREAEFQVRRGRALRAFGGMGAAGVGGLVLCLLAKLWVPQGFEAAVMLFVLGFAASGLCYVRVLRRDWRCPACDQRWQGNDVLAAGNWNHCGACGAALRATPRQHDRERQATARFELEHLPREELEARFLRRRRRGLWAFGAVVLVGMVAFAVVAALGLGELARNAVVAVCAGLGVASVALAARCPRCSVGLMAKGRHCQRCGFALESDAPAQPQA